MEITLKSCPKCGGDYIIKFRNDSDMTCYRCDTCYYERAWFCTEAEAITDWNHHATNSELKEAVGLLKRWYGSPEIDSLVKEIQLFGDTRDFLCGIGRLT